jgi:hypothetical protein
MIIDKSHRSWAVITVVVSIVIAIVYYLTVGNRDGSYLHESVGGSALGLIYGTLALLIFIFAALLGWRRNHPALRVGRMQFWMKGHIWFTVISIPLVVFHSGFQWGSPMTQLLMWTYWTVMISGFLGLAIQHVLPRLMFQRLQGEVVFEQIPYLREQFVANTEAILQKLQPQPAPKKEPVEGEEPEAEQEPPVIPERALQIVGDQILPYLKLDNVRKHSLYDKQTAYDLFQVMRLQTEDQWHDQILELESMVEERRQLDKQTQLQHWLHFWLFFHGPVSLLLLLLTLWHAGVSLLNY